MDLWQESAIFHVPETITVARFDPKKHLVWIGDAEGRISSYYGHHLKPYVSFMGHSGPIKDMIISDSCVISLGDDGLRSHSRNGLLLDSYKRARGDKLLLLDNTEFLVSFQRHIAKYNLDPTIKEIGFFYIDSIPNDVTITHLSKCTPNVALGLSNGTLEIIEPTTFFDTVLPSPITRHIGAITDLDCQKNILVSCGLSKRRYGQVPDAYVSCFDTRTKKIQPPLTVSNGASFVRLHPKAPNYAIVLGIRGQLTFLDSRNPQSVGIKQMLLQENALCLDIDHTGDSLIVAEPNYIHHWSASMVHASIPDFNQLDVPSPVGPLPNMDNDTAPLSAVGMPYFTQDLLSNWSAAHIFETGIPTPDWSKVEDSMQSRNHASVKVRNSKYCRGSSASVPMFLSEQARKGAVGNSVAFVDLVSNDQSLERGLVPKMWRQMHVHYSKFGVDDFDFSYYNKTEYASLEPLSASPFCNALLQVYRWSPTIYNATLKVFAKNNWREIKATGELAIVLDMLVQAQGYHCRATNFMDALQLDVHITEMHKIMMAKLLEEHANEIGEPSPLAHQVATVITDNLSEGEVASKVKKHVSGHPQTIFVVVEALESTGVFPQTVWTESDEEYKLQSYAAEIVNDGEQHGIAVVKIVGEWYIFNDFFVSPVSEADALDFSTHWKYPCLLTYVSTSNAPSMDFSWKEDLDTRLWQEKRLVSYSQDEKQSNTILREGEHTPSLIALDAEFVLVRKELAELHSDGTKSLVFPKKLTLARVSVVREDESVLVDDLVECQQPVVDYVTAFSGVEAGDLDPATSKYGLVAKHTATRRLWILLTLGTKFVGHALINDFRCINLYAPPSQVIDTVNIFYDKDRNGMRKLSLKFLMWAVLGEHVQQGNHDSIQDAQSALKLYRKYLELRDDNRLDNMLADVAAKGQRYNYRVPTTTQVDTTSVPGTPTTPWI